jgi:large subunit ribosomal protein L6
VTGPLGSMEMDCHPKITVKFDSSQSKIAVENTLPASTQCKQMHGTTRALIANMIEGVSKGFERKLEIFGTGYNIKTQGNKLVIQVGFAHPSELDIPKGLKVAIDVPATRGDDVPAKFTLSSMDKQVLGHFSAVVRKIRPPEPYKGKGIRYANEQVKRKVGKAFASGAA